MTISISKEETPEGTFGPVQLWFAEGYALAPLDTGPHAPFRATWEDVTPRGMTVYPLFGARDGRRTYNPDLNQVEPSFPSVTLSRTMAACSRELLKRRQPWCVRPELRGAGSWSLLRGNRGPILFWAKALPSAAPA